MEQYIRSSLLDYASNVFITPLYTIIPYLTSAHEVRVAWILSLLCYLLDIQIHVGGPILILYPFWLQYMLGPCKSVKQNVITCITHNQLTHID